MMNWRSVTRTIVVRGDQPDLSLDELADASRLEVALLRELVDMGVLAPVSRKARPDDWVFPSRSLELMRSAARLRETFDLNTEGLVLALTYRERIRGLENELRRLRCLLGE